MADLKIHIDYKNDRLDIVSKKDYAFKDYMDMLRADVLRIIGDIEEFCYDVNDGKPKDEWDEASWMFFLKTKHKLLDKAGEIGRIPDNIVQEGSLCRG